MARIEAGEQPKVFINASVTPVSPKTGEASNVSMWIILMLAGAAGLVMKKRMNEI